MESPVAYEAVYDYTYDDAAEQSRVLHISIDKLMKIRDPEGSLYLWVPVRNTIHHLRKEPRTEQIQTQEDLLNSEEEFCTEDEIQNFIREYHLDSNENDEIGATLAPAYESMKMNGEFVGRNLNSDINTTNNVKVMESLSSTGSISRKRWFDDLEDCDVQDVFSEFDMPKMLDCIDDDDFLNEGDGEPLPKRNKMDMR